MLGTAPQTVQPPPPPPKRGSGAALLIGVAAIALFAGVALGAIGRPYLPTTITMPSAIAVPTAPAAPAPAASQPAAPAASQPSGPAASPPSAPAPAQPAAPAPNRRGSQAPGQPAAPAPGQPSGPVASQPAAPAPAQSAPPAPSQPAPAPVPSIPWPFGTPGQPAQADSGVSDVVDKVGPAVVSIRTGMGLGSGVIYDPSGLVLTNAHVVSEASEITVVLADGRRLSGKVLGADVGFDLAVVKIEGQNLPSAPLGSSSSLKVGQTVIAIGNPYGFDRTVTTGVVSALNRPIAAGPDGFNQGMVQTSAAIHPGNSGGPLVDLQGNVIGITTLVAAPLGIFPAQGLGFAVPVDTARRVTPQLVADGRVTRTGQPYLGVSLARTGGLGQMPNPFGGSNPFGETPRQQPREQARPGAVVEQVEARGPAGQAGLQAGDRVTTFNGKQVYSTDELLQSLLLQKPGDQVQLEIARGGQNQTVTITIGEAPPRQPRQ